MTPDEVEPDPPPPGRNGAQRTPATAPGAPYVPDPPSRDLLTQDLLIQELLLPDLLPRSEPGPTPDGGASAAWTRDAGGKSRPDPGTTGEYCAVGSEHEHTGGLREGDVLIRRYRLQERIAEGGMSVIWRAFDESLQRPVAVKVHDGPLDAGHGYRELIRREARTAARLHHPDVIEVYDYGETVTAQGRIAAFVVMRLLEGRSLAERLRDGPLPWWEAARIAERIALVLAEAHARGIVHRDVTPENVLLTADGAKLLDFGIAAIEDGPGNELLADYGTPPYVAPERLHGVTTDPAVDVYSLGVLLFEMLTGELPYPERTWEAIEVVRRIGPPPVPAVPNLPSELALLCQSCLSTKPNQRPSAQHAAEILARVAARRRRRHSWPAWLAISGLSVAAVTAAISLSGGLWPAERPPAGFGGTADTRSVRPGSAEPTPVPGAGSEALPEPPRAHPPTQVPPTRSNGGGPTESRGRETAAGSGADSRTARPTSSPPPPGQPPRHLPDEGPGWSSIRVDVALDVRPVVHRAVRGRAVPDVRVRLAVRLPAAHPREPSARLGEVIRVALGPGPARRPDRV